MINIGIRCKGEYPLIKGREAAAFLEVFVKCFYVLFKNKKSPQSLIL